MRGWERACEEEREKEGKKGKRREKEKKGGKELKWRINQAWENGGGRRRGNEVEWCKIEALILGENYGFELNTFVKLHMDPVTNFIFTLAPISLQSDPFVFYFSFSLVPSFCCFNLWLKHQILKFLAIRSLFLSYLQLDPFCVIYD